jgi:nucleoside-diphosphate-sugar epimerase
MSPPPLHVVFGAGQIGTQLAERLVARGYRVRLVRRGPAGATSPNLEWRSGDLSDSEFAAGAAEGASVVYECLNPPYHQWQKLLLPLCLGALRGASRAGARYVVFDNLYHYGRPTGPMREDTPASPTSRKGELRARLLEERLAAHRRGDIRLTIGLAGDLYGPGIIQNLIFGEQFYRRILAKKSAHCFGDPDTPHAYTFGPDVASALLVLGEKDEALGKVWHLPTQPAIGTRALVQMFADQLGRPISISRVPKTVLSVAGVFSPLMREIAEMVYQWEVPFVMDDSRYRAAFGGSPTRYSDGVAAALTWARAPLTVVSVSRAADPRRSHFPAY